MALNWNGYIWTIILTSLFFTGLSLANLIYYTKIRKNLSSSCHPLSYNEATSMIVVNAILMTLGIVIFIVSVIFVVAGRDAFIFWRHQEVPGVEEAPVLVAVSPKRLAPERPLPPPIRPVSPSRLPPPILPERRIPPPILPEQPRVERIPPPPPPLAPVERIPTQGLEEYYVPPPPRRSVFPAGQEPRRTRFRGEETLVPRGERTLVPEPVYRGETLYRTPAPEPVYRGETLYRTPAPARAIPAPQVERPMRVDLRTPPTPREEMFYTPREYSEAVGPEPLPPRERVLRTMMESPRRRAMIPGQEEY